MHIAINGRYLAMTGALILALCGTASAGEWTGPNGGHVSRSGDVEGRLYHGSLSATGPNGATFDTQATCFDGYVNRCYRTYSGTTAAGETYSGRKAKAWGPNGSRTVRAFTGPAGNTTYGWRRVRR